MNMIARNKAKEEESSRRPSQSELLKELNKEEQFGFKIIDVKFTTEQVDANLQRLIWKQKDQENKL